MPIRRGTVYPVNAAIGDWSWGDQPDNGMVVEAHHTSGTEDKGRVREASYTSIDLDSSSADPCPRYSWTPLELDHLGLTQWL